MQEGEEQVTTTGAQASVMLGLGESVDTRSQSCPAPTGGRGAGVFTLSAQRSSVRVEGCLQGPELPGTCGLILVQPSVLPQTIKSSESRLLQWGPAG